MNLFENDYTQNATALFKEALKIKKYRSMNIVLAIFCAFFMLPLVVINAVFAAALYVMAFFFNIARVPVDFIHGVLKGEGENVKHGTQVIVYLIAWPTVFFSYAFLSGTVLLLHILYAFNAILAYLWSFGGFKFHVNPTLSAESEITVDKKAFVLPLIYVCVCAVIVFIIPVITVVIDCIKNDVTNIKWIFNDLKDAIYAKVPTGIYFSAVYSAIASYFIGKDKK